MTDRIKRKQQLVIQGAVYRAQALDAGRAIRQGASIKALGSQVKQAAYAVIEEKLHLKQKNLKKIMPAVLGRVATVSDVSTRYMRKPVLYGAMILGVVSALPRFFKGRKSNDDN
jgi:hypothetical protein